MSNAIHRVSNAIHRVSNAIYRVSIAICRMSIAILDIFKLFQAISTNLFGYLREENKIGEGEWRKV